MSSSYVINFSEKTKRNLIEIFEWAGNTYREALRAAGPGTAIGFDVEEEGVQKYYQELKDFFLFEVKDPSVLHLNAYEAAERRPPPSNEEEFQQNLEMLLEWAGIALMRNIPGETPEKFFESFVAGFSNSPQDVSYIPLHGFDFDVGMGRIKPIQLAPNVTLRHLDFVEQKLLENAIIADPKRAGSVTSLAIVVTSQSQKKAKHGADIQKVLSNLKTLLLGLFGVDLKAPTIFTGRKTPWTPWNYYTSQGSHERPELRTYKKFDSYDFDALKRYWKALNPEVLDRYYITSSRLALAEERQSIEDRIIDLAISLESLLEAEEEIADRLSSILPLLIREKSEDRKIVSANISIFYDLRSAIVHGNRKKREKIFRAFDTVQKVTSLTKDVAGYIQETLKILLLNERVQSKQGQNKFKQNPKNPLIKSPHESLKKPKNPQRKIK